MLRRLTALLAIALLAVPNIRADDDDPKPKKAKKKTEAPVIAHIRLTGDLSEEPVAAEGLFGGSSENLQTKLDRIAKAKSDANVKALYLEIEGLSTGWGKLDELRRAVADVRAAGKKVYAHMESASTKDYLLAAACDVVAIPESGEILIPGLRAEVMFYKDLFNMLRIQADFLQMGEFKGASEPYTRSSMSPEFRKQFETFLDDIYDKSVVEIITSSRKSKNWSGVDVKKLIDEGAFTAKRAKDVGLVDRLAYAKDFEAFIETETAVEDIAVARHYGKEKPKDLDMSSPFAIFKLLTTPKEPVASKKPKVAVIYAVGEIVSGRGDVSLMGDANVGSTTFVEAIREAEKDETVKAIVLRVDSPGGSALASDLIWNELRLCKKPVVASMGDIAASGGYYISMGCRKVFAEPGTLTGSIGVVGGKLVTGKTFEMIGLKTDIISRGANSGLMSSESPWTDSERKVMKSMMEDVYEQFLSKTLANRKKAGVEMSREKLLTLAAGRIWTGRQAKEAGLVDELGTLADAIAAAKRMAGRENQEMELLPLPKPKSIFEKLADAGADVKLPVGALVRDVPGFTKPLKAAESLWKLRGERVWLIAPYRIEVK